MNFVSFLFCFYFEALLSWTPGRSQPSVSAHYMQVAFQSVVFLKLNVSSKRSIIGNLSPALVWYWISYDINDFVSCGGDIVSHSNTSWPDRWTDALKDGVPFWFSPFLLRVSCLRPWMTNGPRGNVLKFHISCFRPSVSSQGHMEGICMGGGYENRLWTALDRSSVTENYNGLVKISSFCCCTPAPLN